MLSLGELEDSRTLRVLQRGLGINIWDALCKNKMS
jgi:hypothetical protein